MTYLTEDYVGVQWLRSIPQLSGTDISNDLVDPWTQIDVDGQEFWKPAWSGQTFISIIKVGDAGDPDEDDYAPIYQAECWARPKNRGASPPWNLANQLAETLRHYPKEIMNTSIYLSLPGSYGGVRVSQMWTMQGPYRGPDNDPLGLAKYTVDFAIVFNPED